MLTSRPSVSFGSSRAGVAEHRRCYWLGFERTGSPISSPVALPGWGPFGVTPHDDPKWVPERTFSVLNWCTGGWSEKSRISSAPAVRVRARLRLPGGGPLGVTPHDGPKRARPGATAATAAAAAARPGATAATAAAAAARPGATAAAARSGSGSPEWRRGPERRLRRQQRRRLTGQRRQRQPGGVNLIRGSQRQRRRLKQTQQNTPFIIFTCNRTCLSQTGAKPR